MLARHRFFIVLLVIHQFCHFIALHSKDINFAQVFSQMIIADIHLEEEHFILEAEYITVIFDKYFKVNWQ